MKQMEEKREWFYTLLWEDRDSQLEIGREVIGVYKCPVVVINKKGWWP